MDSYEGPARLEWQANRTTCLGSFDVNLTVVVERAGWHVSATFTTPLRGEDREAWSFLMGLDPCFTLRLVDDEQAAISVRVEDAAEGGLRLSAA